MDEWRVVIEVAEQEVFYVDADTEGEAEEHAKKEATDLGYDIIGVREVAKWSDEPDESEEDGDEL